MISRSMYDELAMLLPLPAAPPAAPVEPVVAEPTAPKVQP
jgi:hypothetical protein